VIYHLYSYLYFSFANVSDQATASPKILWDAQSLTKNVCSDDWPGVHDWLCVCVCVCVCVRNPATKGFVRLMCVKRALQWHWVSPL
jgi:hypothetical protein